VALLPHAHALRVELAFETGNYTHGDWRQRPIDVCITTHVAWYA